MHRQFELWPPPQSLSPTPKIWNTLTHQQKQDIKVALADLINKMIRSSGNMGQEDADE